MIINNDLWGHGEKYKGKKRLVSSRKHPVTHKSINKSIKQFVKHQGSFL